MAQVIWIFIFELRVVLLYFMFPFIQYCGISFTSLLFSLFYAANIDGKNK